MARKNQNIAGLSDVDTVRLLAFIGVFVAIAIAAFSMGFLVSMDKADSGLIVAPTGAALEAPAKFDRIKVSQSTGCVKLCDEIVAYSNIDGSAHVFNVLRGCEAGPECGLTCEPVVVTEDPYYVEEPEFDVFPERILCSHVSCECAPWIAL